MHIFFVCVRQQMYLCSRFFKVLLKQDMKTKAILAGIMLAATATTAQAGGILTNTNQSIDFLRNPARDAAIGLDGVYSNPAGVAFLPEGFHLGFNWQYAHQTRTIESTSPYFHFGKKNNGSDTKTFQGVADAPCIPSIQAAWNKGDWCMQFNFSVPGGGGSCEFADGLGSFERVVGDIAKGFMTLDGAAKSINAMLQQQGLAAQLPEYGVRGYDMDGYMQGRQYYFGVQLGTAYKVNKDLSVYGGLRLLYGTATYKARLNNIQVGITATDGNAAFMDFGSFLPQAVAQAQGCVSALGGMITKVDAGIAQMEAAGMTNTDQYKALVAQKAQLEGSRNQLQASETRLSQLSKYADGVNLLCNQSGVGIAPVLGIDYRVGKFNFAAKYEFKTEIRMKNESTVFDASEIDAVNKYRDSEEIPEDAPAQLSLGAQWSPIEVVRLNLGSHYYFDKQARWYGDSQKKLDHNSYEILAGAEWDVNDRVTISLGGQLTRYGLTDQYMNDISFVVNSYSIGFGANFKVNDKVTLKGGYFQTNYGDYDRTNYPEAGHNDSFTRTNYVLGLGCELTL